MSENNYKKIAHTILSLPPLKAGEVLRHMDTQEVLEVGEAVLKYAQAPLLHYLQKATSQQTETISSLNILQKRTKEKKSSLEIVKALYRIAFGQKKSQELIKELLRRQVIHKLSFLNVYKDTEILEALENESPLVISMVIGVLKPRNAAKILTLLPKETRASVIQQLSHQSEPDARVVDIVENTLRSKLHTITSKEKSVSTGGIDGLKNILSHLPLETQNTLLNNLNDTSLSQQMKDKLFSWDICDSIDKRYLEETLSEFTLQELARVSFVFGAEVQNAIEKGLSERNKELLEDEIELCKNNPPSKNQTEEIKNTLRDRIRICANAHSATEKMV